MRASYDWKIGPIRLVPELRLAWQHEFGDTDYALVSSFASGAGNSFTVHGPEIGRDSMLTRRGLCHSLDRSLQHLRLLRRRTFSHQLSFEQRLRRLSTDVLEHLSRIIFEKRTTRPRFGLDLGSIRVPACGVRRLAEQSFPAGRSGSRRTGTRALPRRFGAANNSEASYKKPFFVLACFGLVGS